MNRFAPLLFGAACLALLLARPAGLCAEPWRIEPEWHDFGDISDEAPVSHEFRIVNPGPNELVIREVDLSSEACTEYSLSAKRIPPDRSALLRLTFQPFGYSGWHEYHAIVETDDRRVPLRQAGFRATVTPRIPAVLFDDLFAGEMRSVLVRAAREASQTGTTVYATTDYTGLQASVSFPPDQAAYQVTITTVPPQPLRGEVRCRVFIHEPGAQRAAAVIPVWMEILPDFVVAPPMLLLEPVDREQFRILFTSQNPDAPPVDVLRVELPDDRFRAEILPDYRLSNWRINVYAVGLGAETGEIGHIRIHLDREEERVISIPVRIQSL